MGRKIKIPPRYAEVFLCVVLLFSCYGTWLSNQTLLLEGADTLGTYLKANFLAINDKGFYLQVWIPYLVGVALRKANVFTELLSFACDVTLTHFLSFLLYSNTYFIVFLSDSQYEARFLTRTCYTEHICLEHSQQRILLPF